MKGTSNLWASVLQENEFKRKFTWGELYCTLFFLARALAQLIKNNKTRLLDAHLSKRLQLAIKEVNGCVACLYHHPQMALGKGMRSEEISSFLSGLGDVIRPQEVKTMIFVQYFVDYKGQFKLKTNDAIVEAYGVDKAAIIQSVARVMIVDNMYGIPFSAFLLRLQGKSYKKSSVWYEFSLLIVGLLFLPLGLFHRLLTGLIALPNVRFGKHNKENE